MPIPIAAHTSRVHQQIAQTTSNTQVQYESDALLCDRLKLKVDRERKPKFDQETMCLCLYVYDGLLIFFIIVGAYLQILGEMELMTK